MGLNYSLHSSNLFILINLLKKRRLESFIRVKYKAVESRQAQTSQLIIVTTLKSYLKRDLTFMQEMTLISHSL